MRKMYGKGTYTFRDINTRKKIKIKASHPTIAARKASVKSPNWTFISYKKRR